MSLFLNRRADGSLALFIDGDLQFDSQDERIYHECLALPALALSEARSVWPLNALIIGGGDGLTAREVLKSKRIVHVDLVDYDPGVVELARKEFASLNDSSMLDPRMTILIEDAWEFVHRAPRSYDLIIADLTVARDISGAKFHSIEWYDRLAKIIKRDGVLAINGVSPHATPKAYWSIINSALTANLHVAPYHTPIPSFIAQGYGQDWGFLLASKREILLEEFKQPFELAVPRSALKDADHLLKLFDFPSTLSLQQGEALAAHDTSNIFLHYLFNGEPLITADVPIWNSLEHVLPLLPKPLADSEMHLLPPTIRSSLASSSGISEETVLAHVLTLIPALNRDQTEGMVADFLSNPASFLEALDLGALVERLLARAAELPETVVAELEALRDTLIDWTGDHFTLLQLGLRVVTIITVVVVLANLFYPDAAYGKGEHASARGASNHGMSHEGHRAYGGHTGDHWSHWGQWGGRGHYGGWARPWHHYAWGGWGGYGGWGVPAYAFNNGYANVNREQSIDYEGSLYPAHQYNYVTNYNWNDSNSSVSSQVAKAPAHPTLADRFDQSGDDAGSRSSVPPVVRGGETTHVQSVALNPRQIKSSFRLGPDADILPDGNVALQLTDKAYIMLGRNGNELIDQETGKPIISLYADPYLTYHIDSEIKRQSLGLQAAAKSKHSSIDWAGSTGLSSDQAEAKTEVENIGSSVSLLNKASESLGVVAETAPPAEKAPEPDALEIFSSAWMKPDGKYLIVKQANGDLAYLDGNKWYKDAGSTPMDKPYPQQLKSVVESYLTNLTKESDATKSSLLEDQNEAKNRMQTLTDELTELRSEDTQSDDDQVTYGTKQVPRAEAIHRTQLHIRRTQRRLESIQSQLDKLPTEVDAANKLLTTLKT